MESLLEVVGLKKYFGDLHAVDGLDLSVQEEEIAGLIGPNGSGKTTTLNCVSGLLTYIWHYRVGT